MSFNEFIEKLKTEIGWQGRSKAIEVIDKLADEYRKSTQDELLTWNNIDWSKVDSLYINCDICKHSNVKIKGEGLTCDKCGGDLFKVNYQEDRQDAPKIEAHTKVSMNAYDKGFSDGQDDIINTLQLFDWDGVKPENHENSPQTQAVGSRKLSFEETGSRDLSNSSGDSSLEKEVPDDKKGWGRSYTKFPKVENHEEVDK